MTRPKDYDTKCKLHSEMKLCDKDEDRNVCINKTKAYTDWKVVPFTSTNCSKNRDGEWTYSSFSGGKSKRKSKKNKKSKRKTKKNKRKTRKNKRK